MLITKSRILIAFLLLSSAQLFAQKVDYKSGDLQVDGTSIARIVKIKDPGHFGLTSTYELYSMSGKKLIIATIATDFAEDKDDNTYYYYRFTFLTTNQEAVFGLSKFGPEKSFAKQIGASGIIVGDSLDQAKIKEFIALKSKNPHVQVTNTDLYNMVERNRRVIIMYGDNTDIKQDNAVIGRFKDISQGYDTDTYTFSIPEGLVIAKASFTGGTKANHFTIFTLKDNSTRDVTIPVGNSRTFVSSVDRNESTLTRLIKWLVDNNYL